MVAAIKSKDSVKEAAPEGKMAMEIDKPTSVGAKEDTAVFVHPVSESSSLETF